MPTQKKKPLTAVLQNGASVGVIDYVTRKKGFSSFSKFYFVLNELLWQVATYFSITVQYYFSKK